ncbi:hypothetical protein ACM25O_17435 [Sulfitobacter pontiacus]
MTKNDIFRTLDEIAAKDIDWLWELAQFPTRKQPFSKVTPNWGNHIYVCTLAHW